MIQEIKYGGMTTVRSGVDCADGELELAQNCVNEGNGLETFEDRHIIENWGEYKPIYTHKGRYIFVKENVLYYNTTADPKKLCDIDESIVFVCSVGNTLVVSTGVDESCLYFLWDGSGYVSLGGTPPMLELFFGLKQYKSGGAYNTEKGVFSGFFNENKTKWSKFQDVSWGLKNYTDRIYELDEDEERRFAEAAYGSLNKLIADCTKSNKFTQPFFVRYAYRMYDGSLIMHSSPVLMYPAREGALLLVDAAPHNGYTDDRANEYIASRCIAKCNPCTLDFRILKDKSEELNKWSDIIKSIDIFVSKPIYPFDINQRLFQAVGKDMQQGRSDTGLCTGSEYGQSDYGTFNALNWGIVDTNGTANTFAELHVPLVANSRFVEEVENISTFYLLSSYSIDNLPPVDTKWDVKIKDGILETITTQEVMTDDYDSHFPKMFKCGYTYNSRLIMANIKSKIYLDQSFASRLPYNTDATSDKTFSVEVTMDGNNFTIEKTEKFYRNNIGHYIFLPFQGVKKLHLIHSSSIYNENSYAHTFLNSNFLNGSYYFNESRNANLEKYSLKGAPEYFQLELPNKIYVSDVNNPFKFSPQNILTISEEPITALAVSTQAISEGQFGMYPFYAFTEDGTWVLEVSNEGALTRPKPTSRLVCSSQRTTVSTDAELIFATNSGVYSIAGSTPTLISQMFRPDAYFDTSELPESLKNIATTHGATIVDIDEDFNKFAANSVIAYDSVNKRIFVSNHDKGLTYIYSIKSGVWTVVSNFTFVKTLNTYPETQVVAQTSSGYKVCDLSLMGDASSSTIITRPLKLGAPDTFKTIERIIQRGNFEPSHVKQILYGSSDLKTWRLLASSVDKYLNGLRGHAYKYFRLALFMNLEAGESLTGCTIQFTPRGTNVLR